MLMQFILELIGFVFLIDTTQSATNLFCDGDFESYTPTLSYDNSSYQFYRSSMSCWHSQNFESKIEVK